MKKAARRRRPTGPLREKRVAKPWGHETIWAHTDRYVGKILHVRAGHALSLQYHRVKEETIRVLAGRIELQVGRGDHPRKRVRLGPGQGWHLPPKVRHRMRALEDTDILEVSTPQLGDVVRLEDRYHRV
jgi:mannose-6-phosphate isomerase